MKYLLTIYSDESGMANASPEELAAGLQQWTEYNQAAHEAGVLLGGEGLQPTATATVVRQSGGERVLSDGPFAEAREQLGGYYLLDTKDLDEALAWAERIPAVAYGGAVEVRPVMDFGDDVGQPVHEGDTATA